MNTSIKRFVFTIFILLAAVFGSAQYSYAQSTLNVANCAELEALTNIFIENNATVKLTESFSCDAQLTGIGGRFSSIFDGDGHTLTLTSDEPLFAGLSNATVRNLNLSHSTSIDAATGAYYGSLSYNAINGTLIERVGSTVSINNAGSYSAGLVGQLIGSTIRDSYYEGTISGTASYIAGIAGYVGSGSVIERVYATSVSGGQYAGGIAGFLEHTGGPQIIRDSFFDNSLTSADPNYGAIAGLLDNSVIADQSLWLDNNYYNAAAVDENICAKSTPDISSTVGVCEAVNTGGADPFYFLDNDTNAPLDQWDFDDVWYAQAPYPKLQVSISPKLTELSPADGDTDIAIDTDLVMSFDQNLGASSGFIYIKRVSDDGTVIEIDVAGGPELTGNGTDTITLDPLENLEPGTEYYVEIQPSALRGTNGTYFTGINDKERWNFTTAAEALSSTRSSRGSTRRLSEKETREKFQNAGHSEGELKISVTNVSVEYRNICELNFTEIIKRGSRGDAVADVQRCMNSKGYDVGLADGIYGPMTFNGITEYQRSAGLQYVDGIVGPETIAALKNL